MRPKISIIIPAHNSEKYIERPLKSITEQDFPEIEVIVVDNGSTDKTYDRAKEILYNSPLEWKVIKIKKSNVGMARNLGMKKARGEYLYFLDSDDSIAKETLKKVWNRIIETGYPDIVIFGFDILTADDKIIRRYTEKLEYPSNLTMSGIDVLRLLLRRKIDIIIHSAVYNKEFLTKHDIYFLPLWGGEDPNFVEKALFHAKKVSMINESLAFYIKEPKKKKDKHTATVRLLNVIKAMHNTQAYITLNEAPVDILTLLENRNFRRLLEILQSLIILHITKSHNITIEEINIMRKILRVIEHCNKNWINPKILYWLGLSFLLKSNTISTFNQIAHDLYLLVRRY
ncbi:MAG: glycosyltransferase family 2 protein [Candidatus Marinimicrobia bacterium]|nr:glycosyltransferase family 2 protein [Candidatus Neomarinimicrobiota bacterium]